MEIKRLCSHRDLPGDHRCKQPLVGVLYFQQWIRYLYEQVKLGTTLALVLNGCK